MPGHRKALSSLIITFHILIKLLQGEAEISANLPFGLQVIYSIKISHAYNFLYSMQGNYYIVAMLPYLREGPCKIFIPRHPHGFNCTLISVFQSHLHLQRVPGAQTSAA